MTRRLLMVAYHFPPLAGSSGIQRTLRFVQQLPKHGWEPIVLSANPRAYERTNSDLLAEVPDTVHVERAFALNTAKHLALFGRYPAAWARPDRWQSWRWGAIPKGMELIRRLKPDAIWSTYPIATAHLIGAQLARRSGLPWIADFRDPMAQDGYPADPATWRSYDQIEREAVTRAVSSVFTTPGAAEEYQRRYPAFAARIRVIENGYDEPSFAGLTGGGEVLNPGRITILHSGIVYPSERDPRALFAALGRLKTAGLINAAGFALRFRASAHDDMLKSFAAENGIGDLIELMPPVPYRDALAEMMRADALLVMQGNNCNEQIPAKVYEYLRAGRPILALADPPGDTAKLLANNGISGGVALEDSAAVELALKRFLAQLAQGEAPASLLETARRHSREARTKELVALLEQVLAHGVAGRK
ncbi:MAG: glycosyltransferase [Betaproteobacteria bacterium]|nr:glycosyltransferase [Betaproteobacteria bacterium]